MRLDEFSAFPSVSGLDNTEQTRFLCFGFDLTISGDLVYEIVSVTASLLRSVTADAEIYRTVSNDAELV